MAERRMFSKTIIDSDLFLDMPLTAQALYFHLSMRADDEGFVNNPRKIQRMINCSNDDMKLLVAKSFIIPFESGIVVIRHWKIHNYIRGDRKKSTQYKDEKSCLSEDGNGAYVLDDGQMSGKCLTTDRQLTDTCHTQDRLGKDRLGKDSSGEGILTDSCAEPQGVSTPPAIQMPLVSGEQFPIYQQDVDEWEQSFPAVDVLQQLRAMRAWLDANPTKRKTKRGIKRFIVSWLSREQDRGGRRAPAKTRNALQPAREETLMEKQEQEPRIAESQRWMEEYLGG